MTDPAGASGHRQFDPGLQPERTELAWRRTTLALVIGAVVALRILPPALGNWTFAAVFAGLGFTGLIWLLAGRRARETRQALLEHGALPRGGGLLLLLALTAALGGALGLAYAALG
jgi:putative membrane protein